MWYVLSYLSVELSYYIKESQLSLAQRVGSNPF